MKVKNLDVELIKKMYFIDKLSSRQISRKLDTNHKTIQDRLKGRGLKLRGKYELNPGNTGKKQSEYQKNKAKKLMEENNPMKILRKNKGSFKKRHIPWIKGKNKDNNWFCKMLSDKQKNNNTCKFVRNPSKPQKRIYEILKKIYPNAELNYKFLRLNGENHYYLDIAIPNLKLDFEVDGEYWHRHTKEKDKLRDDELNQMGWRVVRINV